MDIIFRIASPKDMELLMQLAKEYYAYDGHPYNEQKIPPAIKDFIDDSTKGTIWIIESRKVSIGYMVLCLGYSLEYYGVDAFLDEIYIREAFRGKGIGKQAMEFLEIECRNRNVQALHLEVEQKTARHKHSIAQLALETTIGV